jgi:flavodoxin I
VKLCVLEFLWQNISDTKSQRHKKPQKIKHLKAIVNLNIKQSLNFVKYLKLIFEMKKIGLFYGTTGGQTMKVAELIQKEFGSKAIEIFNIKNITPEDILKFDYLIFGTSAWGVGDMQDDWEVFIDEVSELDFSGKKIALFGLGDQVAYPGSFADGLGTLYCRLQNKENIIGFCSAKGYKYYYSSAEKDGKFVGLVLDVNTQDSLTPERVKKWVSELKKEFK